MKKILVMAMVVAMAGLFTVRADEAAPAKAGSKPACSACKACTACEGCKKADGLCAACMPAKCRVLSIKDGKAYCCACPRDCKCTLKDDATTCSCGKEVKSCELKGKFVCDCPADCSCARVSSKPGKCACGKELKEVK